MNEPPASPPGDFESPPTSSVDPTVSALGTELGNELLPLSVSVIVLLDPPKLDSAEEISQPYEKREKESRGLSAKTDPVLPSMPSSTEHTIAAAGGDECSDEASQGVCAKPEFNTGSHAINQNQRRGTNVVLDNGETLTDSSTGAKSTAVKAGNSRNSTQLQTEEMKSPTTPQPLNRNNGTPAFDTEDKVHGDMDRPLSPQAEDSNGAEEQPSSDGAVSQHPVASSSPLSSLNQRNENAEQDDATDYTAALERDRNNAGGATCAVEAKDDARATGDVALIAAKQLTIALDADHKVEAEMYYPSGVNEEAKTGDNAHSNSDETVLSSAAPLTTSRTAEQDQAAQAIRIAVMCEKAESENQEHVSQSAPTALLAEAAPAADGKKEIDRLPVDVSVNVTVAAESEKTSLTNQPPASVETHTNTGQAAETLTEQLSQQQPQLLLIPTKASGVARKRRRAPLAGAARSQVYSVVVKKERNVHEAPGESGRGAAHFSGASEELKLLESNKEGRLDLHEAHSGAPDEQKQLTGQEVDKIKDLTLTASTSSSPRQQTTTPTFVTTSTTIAERAAKTVILNSDGGARSSSTIPRRKRPLSPAPTNASAAEPPLLNTHHEAETQATTPTARAGIPLVLPSFSAPAAAGLVAQHPSPSPTRQIPQPSITTKPVLNIAGVNVHALLGEGADPPPVYFRRQRRTRRKSVLGQDHPLFAEHRDLWQHDQAHRIIARAPFASDADVLHSLVEWRDSPSLVYARLLWRYAQQPFLRAAMDGLDPAGTATAAAGVKLEPKPRGADGNAAVKKERSEEED